MKTYVLIVSRYFQQTHTKAGEQTLFVEKIEMTHSNVDKTWIKKHTIRGNYKLWKKRIKEINEGKAILSLRYWSGKPYNSKQIEFLKLNKVGLQKLKNPDNFVHAKIDKKIVAWEEVAKNDGLSFVDFCGWFKVRQSEPMAIIHFTDFRY